MSSSPSDTPKRTVFPGNEDQEMLESLTGLSIKGFQDCTEPNANTPSSTNASLPTPPALKTSHVLLASPERSPRGHDWYSEERSIPPNAPLLKDLDSFTEGTGQGSFDFPLTTGPDDGPVFPLIFHPTENIEGTTRHSSRNSLDLDSLPLASDPNDVVLAWIESISPIIPPPQDDSTASELPPKKRRRSFTQDDDTEDDRRNRSWSPSIDAHFVPPCALTEEEDPELVVHRTEPDAPG